MKKNYMTPSVEIERFSLTDQLASCAGLKINLSNSQCVLNDPDATNQMKSMAYIGMFLSSDANGCAIAPTGMDGSDGICYHTNVNMAFTS